METVLKSPNLAKRAFWLIKLRWLATFLLAGATFAASAILGIELQHGALYSIAMSILLYNAVLWLTLYRIIKYSASDPSDAIGRIILLQVTADLFILTGILYFSGSVENPFSFYFVFHMIIASMILSRALSYFQATLAVIMFGALLTLEYFGILRHHQLVGFADNDLYLNGKYLLGMFFVFATTMYLVVYMTTTIIAQLRKQQEDYRQANTELEMKDRVKNEYIMRVTHDIKGHLAAIKSCLDIVSTGMVGPLNEKQQDLVQRSDHRASRCITFIKALLRLTRVRLTGELERSEFSLKNVIFNSFAAAEDRAVKGDIKLSYEVDPAIDLCYGNALLIEDTITNLLLIAVKYTPQAGNVKLDVHSRGDDIIMQISDTGIGIPAGEIDRIFDEFYRASNAKKLERDGTGLGLSMAKEVIERHGGKIWVESGNTGSIFSFSLPKDGITNPADS